MSEPEDDFAAMFEASLKAKSYERGQTIEGTIVAIGHDVALVDVGGKSEAALDLSELRNDDGTLEAQVGDRIQATVMSTAGGIQLSRRGVRGAATLRQIESAYEAGLPVEGRVEKQTKGGYEVRVAGQRAFCPLSQIDVVRTVDPAVHEGQTYSFKVIEFKEGGRNLVVSRRALLAQENEARAAEVRQQIVAGAVLPGRVVSVRDFGAFVDLGGNVQGLLHVSEMAWSRVGKVSDVVAPGEEITVKVLRIDEASGNISLSLKQLGDDPWSTVAERYAAGQVYQARVTRVAQFGAFVELEPGIEALAHASTFPPTGRSGGWQASVGVGQTAAFEVLSVDPAQKRIGVAPVAEGTSRAASATQAAGQIVPGARIVGKVEKHEPFGVFVFLAPGKSGLMPMRETGIAKETEVAKAFPVGADVEVVVLEVDPAGRRIRVSHQAVIDAAEQAEVREYSERPDVKPPSGGLGSLADKLRGALDTRPGRDRR